MIVKIEENKEFQKEFKYLKELDIFKYGESFYMKILEINSNSFETFPKRNAILISNIGYSNFKIGCSASFRSTDLVVTYQGSELNIKKSEK